MAVCVEDDCALIVSGMKMRMTVGLMCMCVKNDRACVSEIRMTVGLMCVCLKDGRGFVSGMKMRMTVSVCVKNYRAFVSVMKMKMTVDFVCVCVCV